MAARKIRILFDHQKQGRRFGLLIAPLVLLLLVISAISSAGASSAAHYNLTDRLWKIETVLAVDVIPPHFDYLNAGYSQGTTRDFYFSYIEPATNDLRVAHWISDSLKIETVAHSETPGALSGAGNDLEFMAGAPVISYSLLNPNGSGSVALARYDGSWVSETIAPAGGGGSTRFATDGEGYLPHSPVIFYSGSYGLFEAHENPAGPGWLTERVDAGADANTPLSMATDRMGFTSLAYCGQTAEGSALMEAWPNFYIDLWEAAPVYHETCADAMHFGAHIGGGTQYIISTNSQLKFYFGGDDRQPTVIDNAPKWGWTGRGLSGGTDVTRYWLSYTAYDPSTGHTSLRLAYHDIYEGGWQTVAGPAGDFAEWTHLESLWFDGSRPVKISLLYYDIAEGALKRASWPPDPDFFLPIIHNNG